ncbi:MAG: SOUL family heme-binding protein [Hyphomicrobiaceae bacterium]
MTKIWRITALAVAGIAVLGMTGWVGAALYVNDVEQPAYRVVQQDGAIELRDYPALVVAEVTRPGDRREAVNAAFGPLARYIFARERAGPAIPMTVPVTQQGAPIAMTAPVTQQPAAGAGGSWAVRFVMPSRYTLETLPVPAGADVRLVPVPAVRRAVIRFSGIATDSAIAREQARLEDWVARRGVRPAGPPTYAYYNAPFTPWFLRRNEVWLELPAGS